MIANQLKLSFSNCHPPITPPLDNNIMTIIVISILMIAWHWAAIPGGLSNEKA
jgi:hypothetical protein